MNLQGHTKGLYSTRYKVLYASVIHLHHQRRESFKACPLNTLAHPGQAEQAQAQHVNKINCSCDTHSKSFIWAFCDLTFQTPWLPIRHTLYGCTFKTGSRANSQTATHLFGARKQTWRWTSLPGVPQLEVPTSRQTRLHSRLRNPSLTCFQRDSIKMLFISER